MEQKSVTGETELFLKRVPLIRLSGGIAADFDVLDPDAALDLPPTSTDSDPARSNPVDVDERGPKVFEIDADRLGGDWILLDNKVEKILRLL